MLKMWHELVWSLIEEQKIHIMLKSINQYKEYLRKKSFALHYFQQLC